MLFHSKELNELEEVLKILLEKMRSIIYNVKKDSCYGSNPNERLYENRYGHGELVNPRAAFSSYSGDLEEYRAMKFGAERVIILKRDDYNRFNAMHAEFIHKANKYIQLLKEVDTFMPANIRDVIENYKEIVYNFYWSYKYVVE